MHRIYALVILFLTFGCASNKKEKPAPQPAERTVDTVNSLIQPSLADSAKVLRPEPDSLRQATVSNDPPPPATLNAPPVQTETVQEEALPAADMAKKDLPKAMPPGVRESFDKDLPLPEKPAATVRDYSNKVMTDASKQRLERSEKRRMVILPQAPRPAIYNNNGNTGSQSGNPGAANPESAAIAAAVATLNTARKAAYDSIRLIRDALPDSLARVRTTDERTYYNRHSFHLSSLQLQLLNQMDGANIAALRLEASEIGSVIAEFEPRVLRLQRFTQTLRQITDVTDRMLQAATFLIGQGIIVPSKKPAELN